jgi:hypothetical protein
MNDDYYIGDPSSQIDDWMYQELPDNCAVAAETSIINQFRPDQDDLSIEDASYISASHGWYDPGMGTSPDEIGNMMDLYGIPNHTVSNASIDQLAYELQQGHGVIVGVNSDDLWDQGPLSEFLEFLMDAFGLDRSDIVGADHAITVTGIDVSDPENPMVVINDSGTPDGAGVRYPLDKFKDAWENSGFYYTATDVPIPDQESPTDLGFDVGDFLGLGTTLLTGDPVVGQLVNEFTDIVSESGDWDSIAWDDVITTI